MGDEAPKQEQTKPAAKKPEPKPEPASSEEPKVDPFGRIVRYVTPTETIRPAIVTRVHEDGAVDLTVFNSEGAVPATRVLEEPPVDGDYIPHSFHWPAR